MQQPRVSEAEDAGEALDDAVFAPVFEFREGLLGVVALEDLHHVLGDVHALRVVHLARVYLFERVEHQQEVFQALLEAIDVFVRPV